MAVTTIKSTYSLDPKTVRALDELARRWSVSKSEVIRRAVHEAQQRPASPSPDAAKRLAALDALQRGLNLSDKAARRWVKQVGAERKEWTARIGRLGK
jgi:hypothetical protein